MKNAATAVKSESSTASTISGKLADYAAGLRYDDLPANVRDMAQMVLLDTLGCGLAGSVTEELRLIRKTMIDAAGAGDSRLWGTSERASLPFAALANGAAVHAREMDDFGGCMHSGSVVVPAAFCTAARVGASGRDLLTAIVAGYDIARRAMDGGGGYQVYKDIGWHSTSTCGGFGAAAAAALLLKLDAQQIQWALGYAGSNAGGTWAYIPDGAMSKRLHPGFAAQTGVIAAYLASNNVTGPTSIFEAAWGGFFPTYIGDKATPEKTVDGLGTDFRILLSGFKPYAACRGNHSSIDSMLALRREHGLRAEMVDHIKVGGSPTHVKQLAKQNVKTMLDAQFSIPYSIAVSLATGGAMLDQYSPEQVRRPEILAIASRVKVEHDPRVKDGEEPFIEVHLKDGRVLPKRVLIARGDRENPLTEEELRAKFRTTAGQALNPTKVAALEKAVARVADMKHIGELAELLVP
jgi:2-methylcitrate dehydratase PrpD